MPNVQFCIKLLQEIGGWARELKLSERGIKPKSRK